MKIFCIVLWGVESWYCVIAVCIVWRPRRVLSVVVVECFFKLQSSVSKCFIAHNQETTTTAKAYPSTTTTTTTTPLEPNKLITYNCTQDDCARKEQPRVSL